MVSRACTSISPDSMPRKQLAETFRVERLAQAVVQGLAHQRVIGQLDGAGLILLALGEPGEDRGHQVVGLHALDRRRILATAAEAQHREGAGPRFQRQRAVNIGVSSTACSSVPRREPLPQHARKALERKAVLRPQREHHRVVVGRRLQLEVEADLQMRLRTARPSARLMRPPKGSVHHQLHAAGLVEEALDHQAPSWIGRDAERDAATAAR